jgi:hypothetical protein
MAAFVAASSAKHGPSERVFRDKLNVFSERLPAALSEATQSSLFALQDYLLLVQGSEDCLDSELAACEQLVRCCYDV